MIKGILWFAAVLAMSPFLLACVVAGKMARRKRDGGNERYLDEDDGLGDDDPGIDVDAEPINVDGTRPGNPAAEDETVPGCDCTICTGKIG